MSLFESEEISNATEELIITGMLHNTAFLSYINKVIQIHYFENKDCGTLAEMAIEFFDDNKKAPGLHSVELLDSVRDIVGDQAKNIEKLLKKIDAKYGGREVHTNILVSTARDWLKSRSMRTMSKDINKLLDRGNIEEAEKKMEEVRKNLTLNGEDSILAVDIFNEDIIPLMELEDTVIMKFNNDLDKFFPPQANGRFYTFLGGKKSGKSQWLQYIAITGLENGLNVLAITFELTEAEYLKRLWAGISGCRIDMIASARTKKKINDVALPIFDCKKNRTRVCQREECPENGSFSFTEFEDGEWNPCDFCIGEKEKSKKMDRPSPW